MLAITQLNPLLASCRTRSCRKRLQTSAGGFSLDSLNRAQVQAGGGTVMSGTSRGAHSAFKLKRFPFISWTPYLLFLEQRHVSLSRLTACAKKARVQVGFSYDFQIESFNSMLTSCIKESYHYYSRTTSICTDKHYNACFVYWFKVALLLLMDN